MFSYRKILEYLRAAQGMTIPAFFFCGALVINAAFPEMSSLGFSLLHYSLFVAAAIGGLLSCWFNRTRVLFSIIIIMLGYYLAYDKLYNGVKDDYYSTFFYPAFGFLLPINLVIFSWLEERGVFTVHGIIRIIFVLAQILLIYSITFYSGYIFDEDSSEKIRLLLKQLFSAQMFEFTNGKLSPLSQPSLLVFSLGFFFFLLKAVFNNKPMDYGFLIALVSLCLGLHYTGQARPPSEFFLASVLSLSAAVIHDSYHMAFNDQLTGIPGRQALVADLKKLGSKYSIAMVDIDHFKKFNDTYGHDVGDQVLRMVASHLRNVNGKGKAYRYGGEEFTIIFSGKTKKEAIDYLEETRKTIEKAGFKIRDKNRDHNTEEPSQLRGKIEASANIVMVTVSMGIAEKGRSDSNPEDVIKKADQALYKAKKDGRNKVVAAL